MRIRGANGLLRAGFEASWGVMALTANYFNMPFDSCNLGSVQDLAPDPVLGFGRDGADPYLEAEDNMGDLVVPVDPRSFGIWLKAMFGNPVTAAALAATGGLTFSAQPAVDSTISVGGTEFTFKASGATGNQVSIGANLAATMTALATALNASVVPGVAAATYTATATGITIVHDTLGPAGNAFALAASSTPASNAKVSAATLRGGANTHTFSSGATSLPSLSIEVGNPDGPMYAMNTGVMVNTMRLQQSRKGRLVANINLRGQKEVSSTTSFPTSPTSYAYADLLIERMGELRLDGTQFADCTSSDIEFSNNLDVVEGIRGDGLVSGIDPADFTSTGKITARVSDTTMLDRALAGTPVEIQRNWAARPGIGLSVIQHRVFIPRQKRVINGPAGVEVEFATLAARDSSAGKKMTVILTNDVASY